ncbi:MAG: diguanylate cyclase, partial [Acidimicrobiales bacterium]
ARVGGDEFVAVVAGDSAVAPAALAERFASAIAISPPRSCAVALAASIGWAVDDGIARSDELVHHADARMYEAKRAKRAARPRQQDR